MDVTLIPYRNGNKWGFADPQGNIVIPCTFEDAHPFKEGLAAVMVDELIGFINPEGKLVIPADYEDVSDFSEGLAAVLVDDKYGYINSENNMVIAPAYDFAGLFKNGYAEVEVEEAGAGQFFGIINQEGKDVIELSENFIIDIQDKMAFVGMDDRYELIYLENNTSVPLPYEDLDVGAQTNLIAVAKGYDETGLPTYGYVDQAGEIKIDFQFEEAYGFFEGRAIIAQNDLYGLIDEQGDVIVAPQFEDTHEFSEGLLAAKKDDKWGFLDKSGKTVIGFEYDYAGAFKEGRAYVRKEDKYGFIDIQGEIVIPLKYEADIALLEEADIEFAQSFENGLVLVNVGDNVTYIDLTGKEFFND